jgi:hypothetical protein
MTETVTKGAYCVTKNGQAVQQRTAAGDIRVDGLIDKLQSISSEDWGIVDGSHTTDTSGLSEEERAILDR